MGLTMDKVSAEDSGRPGVGDGSNGPEMSPKGVSPYATGGGGVTFERKVAAQYLAHLLLGDDAPEFGNGRRAVSVAFQQAPSHAVDDLVVSAALPDELEPSLVLALAVRRSPKFVVSNTPAQKLIGQFVRAVTGDSADEPEHRFGLVVSGQRDHARQLAYLADLAAKQIDERGFFDLILTPGKFDTGIRRRLCHLEKLVQHALDDLGVAEAGECSAREWTWQLLSKLTVLMPQLEAPDERDWSGVVNNLRSAARDSDLIVASSLRDRLVELASEYSPSAARVDLAMLRRASHSLLDLSIRRHQAAWQILGGIDQQAREFVRAEIKAVDDERFFCLDRGAKVGELVNTVSGNEAVVVSGESGVGKSALAVLGLTSAADADPEDLQVLCINLRQIPKLAIEFEGTLRHPLSALLSELSAPQRMLVVDGADSVTEDRRDAFCRLVAAARMSGLKLVAITSIDSKQVVLDAVRDRFDTGVAEFVVPPLDDSELDEIVGIFPELVPLNANPRSRELLRRLVVVDLLVRAKVSGIPLTDADAMKEVWFGLVRRREMSDRGFPDARETALLRLAALELGESERLEVVNSIDPAALNGLRRDGLLRNPDRDLFKIGPEFVHDEVRRYAVARLLLASDNPASSLIRFGSPRWSLAAAQLACQAWLEQPHTSAMPLRGRLAALQASFDTLDASPGSRWGDVPSEAVLKLANPEALLRDAWPGLLADDSAGLRRFARLVDQRLRDNNGIVDLLAVEPIIALLLEDSAPWRSGKHVEELLRDWLHAHIVADASVGQPLRIRLREHLLETCAEGDRRLTEERDAAVAARAARTPEEVERERRFMAEHGDLFSEIGYGGQTPRRKQRDKLPREITDKVIVELLALLGPDLGDDGERILGRVAKNAPSWLGPAVEQPLAGRALASGRRGFLAELTEAYYLDDETDIAGFDLLEDGIRRHRARSIYVPQTAWYRGPFMSLFQSDFRNGVRVLNRLLNHAARARVGKLARLGQSDLPFDSGIAIPYENELQITGTRRLYVGDEHVWRWYRGTGVGPYPCMSALQALERVCDQLIESNIPIRNLAAVLLDGCENLAMVGLIVGLLVRHLERSERLLAPYLAEPLIWRLEFARMPGELGGFKADSEGLVAPDRQNWSLRETAMFMVVKATGERIEELRAVGEVLVENARQLVEPGKDREPARVDSGTDADGKQLITLARAWASSLDRSNYRVRETEDGFSIETTPPADVAQALQDTGEDLKRTSETTRLFIRYGIDHKKENAADIGVDELVADIAVARTLLETLPPSKSHDPWNMDAWAALDASAMVAAAALEAHLVKDAGLPDEALSFCAELVVEVGNSAAEPRPFEFDDSFYEPGARRSAARVLPLLLLPVAADLRAVIDGTDGSTALERAFGACVTLAGAVADEVRLYLARGLDRVWEKPCAENGCCHHELGWRIVAETMRYCVIGDWDRNAGRPVILPLQEPFTESLARAADDSIIVSRLDPAVRALAPAAVANICIAPQAQDLLSVLLAAQRRSLLSHEHEDPDPRDSHTLVSARALLTLARDSSDAALYEHIDAYADNPTLLEKLLEAMSAAGEETPERAATAKRIWPGVIRYVLQLDQSGQTPFRETHYGEGGALASLIPNPTGELPYLYREVNGKPIKWWNPLEMVSEVEAWLVPAVGNPRCVDQLIGFLDALGPDDQVRVGLPWVAKLVKDNSNLIANRSYLLPTWLIEIRPVAADTELLAIWQQIVDDLVVADVARLAPYSV